MLNVKKIIKTQNPRFYEKHPLLVNSSLPILKTLFKEAHINEFLRKNSRLEAKDFIDSVLEHLGADFKLSSKDLKKIPSIGRLVVVANHPLGGIDALLLLRLILLVRDDVKILATPILKVFKPLQSLFIQTDNIDAKNIKQTRAKALEHLSNDGLVVIFPAAQVSRLGVSGIKDSKWTSGFFKLARQSNAGILPVRIDAKNSRLFYGVSMLYKPLSTALLPRELFKQKNKEIKIFIGKCVDIGAIKDIAPKIVSKLMYKQILALGNSQKEYFKSSVPIDSAQDVRELKKELKNAQILGSTSDDKKIFLVKWQKNSKLIKEIGRLRELSFRRVGEGSGKQRDNDQYDKTYDHIILWDENSLEIVGSYRLADAQKLSSQNKKLYTKELFNFNNTSVFENAIELGRSFITPKFWSSRSLDYLWQGIGAYLRTNSAHTTLFGAVSISAAYSLEARQMIVYFYSKFFYKDVGISPKNPFIISENTAQKLDELFANKPQEEAFKTLKNTLEIMGYSVPTLYKQYTALCKKGGVYFAGFSVDESFGSCVDGLIFIDTTQMTPPKKKRYLGGGD